MDSDFVLANLIKFMEFGSIEQGWVGHNPAKWANDVLSDSDVYKRVPTKQLTRGDLYTYCLSKSNGNIETAVAIFSWGGMRRDHGRRILKEEKVLIELIQNLRTGIYLSRKEAYHDFHQHRMRNKLPGLGIGYFTKLICFLAPQLNGYILDQWLGKSINLLTGKKLVSITDKGWVTDKNDANTYEVFCSKVDALAKLIQCSGLETEERLFSKGAIGKSERGAWRKYVMKHS